MLIKLKVNSTQNWQKTHEAQKESSLSKEWVEIGDFYKPAMTTHELCMKYNLLASIKKLYVLNHGFKYNMYSWYYSSIELLIINSVTAKPTW